MKPKGFVYYYDKHVTQLDTPCLVTKAGYGLKMIDNYGSMKAVWDTGARCTTISANLIERLNLKRVGIGMVNTMSGTHECEYYEVDILLPGKMAFYKRKVMKGILNGFDILIGMDIMSMGGFAFSNAGNETVLNFKIPSDKDIDFSKE